MTISSSKIRVALGCYFSLLAAIVALYVLHNVRHPNGWSLTDWIINYTGGFVRRGFLGEVLLLVSRELHLPLLSLAAGVQVVCFSTFLAMAFVLSRRVELSWAWLAVFLSPATFSFVALNPPVTLKEDVLIFLAVGLCISVSRRRDRVTFFDAVWLTLLTQALLLSHEASAMYVAYIFAPFLIRTRDWRKAVLLVIPVLLLLPTVYAVSHHLGSENTAAQICRSVGGTWPADPKGLCGGAIHYLTETRATARIDTAAHIGKYHYFLLYGLTSILSLFPLALVARTLWHDPDRRPMLRWLFTASALAWLASLVLFVMATDWGRWIHIHSVCLVFLLMMVAERRDTPTETARPFVMGAHGGRKVAALAAYALLWTLPGVATFVPRFGVPALVWYFATYGKQ